MEKIEIKYNGKIPSINNRYFKNFSLRPEYREFKDKLGWTAKKETKKMLTGAVSVEILFRIPKRKDIDAGIKATLDALNNICYKDDSQIVRLLVLKETSKEEEIRIFLTSIPEIC